MCVDLRVARPDLPANFAVIHVSHYYKLNDIFQTLQLVHDISTVRPSALSTMSKMTRS